MEALKTMEEQSFYYKRRWLRHRKQTLEVIYCLINDAIYAFSYAKHPQLRGDYEACKGHPLGYFHYPKQFLRQKVNLAKFGAKEKILGQTSEKNSLQGHFPDTTRVKFLK